jgi:mono/diheme cytochrome c family protein
MGSAHAKKRPVFNKARLAEFGSSDQSLLTTIMLRRWQRIGMAGGVALVVCSVSAWVVVAADPPAATQDALKVPARDAQKKNPIPPDEGSLATGKQVYVHNCMPCHGATGKGNGPIAKMQDKRPANLTDSKFAKETDGTLFWRISNGHRPMPKFENSLPAESRWNVVNYLRTLIVVPATEPSTEPSTKPK